MEQGILLQEKVCKEIVDIGHELIVKNLVAGSWGNISCRIDEKHIAITPSGLGYQLLTPDDIVILDNEGNVVSGKHIPSSESKVHLAIYKAYPKAQAIIHTHSIYASAFAAMRKTVPAIIEDIAQICGGSIKCAEYALTGTKKLADNAVLALEERKAVLLANHGAVCWGKSLAEALLVAEILEKTAHIASICAGCGNIPVQISAEDTELMHTFYEEHYLKRQLGKE